MTLKLQVGEGLGGGASDTQTAGRGGGGASDTQTAGRGRRG